MKKIQTYLIHLLGGITMDEALSTAEKLAKDIITNGGVEIITEGNLIATKRIKQHADMLDGTPADEWCKAMYKLICRDIELYEMILQGFKKSKSNESEQDTTPQHTEAD